MHIPFFGLIRLSSDHFFTSFTAETFITVFFVHLFRVDVVCCLLLLRSVIFFWIRTRECTSHTYVTHKNVLGPFVNEIFVYVDNITAGVMSVDWLTRSMRVSVGATRVACLLYAPEHTHTHHTANKKRHKSYA